MTEASVQEQFDYLVNQWNNERPVCSSNLGNHIFCPSYQKIIKLGEPAIRLILLEMVRQEDWWFYALNILVKEPPFVNFIIRGNLSLTTEIWLDWAVKKNIISEKERNGEF